MGVVAGSIFATLAAAITNLISELTGGIRFTVIEVDEEDGDDARRAGPLSGCTGRRAVKIGWPRDSGTRYRLPFGTAGL